MPFNRRKKNTEAQKNDSASQMMIIFFGCLAVLMAQLSHAVNENIK
jgi:hypothetical protein